jgi:hypothetical protein
MSKVQCDTMLWLCHLYNSALYLQTEIITHATAAAASNLETAPFGYYARKMKERHKLRDK